MSVEGSPAVPHEPEILIDHVRRFAAMGGWVTLRVAAPAGERHSARHDLHLLEGRIHAWAGRISRFEPDSELSRLNRDAAAAASVVGPSVGDLLSHSVELKEATDGLVDVTLLAERLAAEQGGIAERPPAQWWSAPAGRRIRVHRSGPLVFDLDGVGKGWIADRACALLARYPAVMVDADGDVALHLDPARKWAVGIADPQAGLDLATISPPTGEQGRLGIATSGTSVHRWEHGHGWAHHLIDPRTGLPADTDVVQATVVAGSALEAEALAKAAVIAGSEDGLRLLEGNRARAAFLLLRDGDLVAPPDAERWLV